MENKDVNSSDLLNANSADSIINSLENMGSNDNNSSLGFDNAIVDSNLEKDFVSMGAANIGDKDKLVENTNNNFISMGAAKVEEKAVVNSSIDNKDDATFRNEMEFQKIMENVQSQHSSYYDINHPVVKGILFALFGIGLFGVVYYIAMWFLNK